MLIMEEPSFFDIEVIDEYPIVLYEDLPEYVKGAADAYYIQGENTDYIIDCLSGRFNFYNQIINDRLKYRNTPKDKPITVLITHTHIDHSGGLKDFENKPNVNIYVHESEIYQLKQGLDMHDVVKKKYVTYKDKTLIIPKINNVLPLHDNQEFYLDKNNVIKCIHTPGHSIGSMSFYIEKWGVLFTGDTFYGNKNLMKQYNFENKMTLQNQSILKLYNLGNISKVLAGHGGESFKEFQKYIQMILKGKSNKKQKVIECYVCGIPNVVKMSGCCKIPLCSKKCLRILHN